MPPKRKPLGAAELPSGWILTDNEQRTWMLGSIIGRGGFGLIYLASQQVSAPVPLDASHVIKVEFHENGPLFCELKFYQRAAKAESLMKWKKTRHLDFLGIPTYWGCGQSEYNGTRYRFMVMDRLGCDLQKECEPTGGRLKKDTALQLCCCLLDVLEYIHEHEYVHADIKPANLLRGYHDPGKVYLVDYGLSYRYLPQGVHKEYKEDPKKRHNGTIEYTSLDAHRGVAPSRRGDLEGLGYCLLQWLSGTLPWMPVLKNMQFVYNAKDRLMAGLPDSVLELSTPGSGTEEVALFLRCVKSLAYDECPDYKLLKDILKAGVGGMELDLNFSRHEGEATCSVQRKAVMLSPKRRAAGRLEQAQGAKPKTKACAGTEVTVPMPARLKRAQAEGKPGPLKTEKPKMPHTRAAERRKDREKDKCEEQEEEVTWTPEEGEKPKPRYGLRERPTRRRDPNWPLKLYSSVITFLFLLLVILHAL